MIKNGIATGFGDEWIRLGATSEHTCDGSFSERTMALSVPYPGVEPEYHGNVTTTQDDLNAWVERVHRAGIQVNCHANGDVTIDMVLTAFERAQRLFPLPDPRPKITHCTLINDDLRGATPRLTTNGISMPKPLLEALRRQQHLPPTPDEGPAGDGGGDDLPGAGTGRTRQEENHGRNVHPF